MDGRELQWEDQVGRWRGEGIVGENTGKDSQN